MLIARVIGDLTATRKHPSHEGKKILLVQPLELDGSNRGQPVVALDSVNAGIGERVLLTLDGYAAFTAVGETLSPIDAAVIGIVDHVEMDSRPVSAGASPAKKKKKQDSDQNHDR
jgi:ethanolamine utilization protein EutN